MRRPFRLLSIQSDTGSKRRSRRLRLEALESREMLSVTPSFAAEQKWHDWFCAGTEIPLVGDFNGDGKDDIATFTRGNTGDVYVALSNGSSFVGQGVKWHDLFCTGSSIPLAGDFDGDGKDDIAAFTRGTTGDVFVALSNGSSFARTPVKWHDWFCVNSEIPLAGDFNGDGKDDLATFTRGTTGDVFVALSNGSSFVGQGAMWHDWFCINSETPLVADFDADGKDDLATFTCGSTGDVYVTLSEGNTFSDPAWKWHESFCFGQDLPALGDFNGDGKVDLARFTRGNTADVWVASSTLQYGANFAVLFSGGVNAANNPIRYYDNIKSMYQTLITQCNFRPEHVYIIYADGTNSAVDRDDGKNSDMSYAAGSTVLSATKAHLLDTLDKLADDVDAKDHFLFYSFDHGGGTLNRPTTTGEEVLCGWGEDIRDDELAPALRSIHGKYSSYVFAQCYSGGMLDDLMPLPANAFGCAATNHYEYSWGDGFAAAFVDALQAGLRNTSNLYQSAYQNDPYAVQTAYPPNGGTYADQKEHPWSVGGSFPMFLSSPSGAANSTKSAADASPSANGIPSLGNSQTLPPLTASELGLLAAGVDDQKLANRVCSGLASMETILLLDAHRQAIRPAICPSIAADNPPRTSLSDPALLGAQNLAKCSSAGVLSSDRLVCLDKGLAKNQAVHALFAQDGDFWEGVASPLGIRLF